MERDKKMKKSLFILLLGGVAAMACAKEKKSDTQYVQVTELQKNIAEKTEKLTLETNPIMTHKFAADPAVLIYKDTIYVYSTNDMQQLEFTLGKEENRYNKINTLNIFSSKDLVNWTDLGEVDVAGKNGGKGDAAWASNSWAPAIAWKNIGGKDKFFLYFADSGNGIGVLTADSPTGPFTDPIKKPLISRQTPNCANVNWLFDPAVMVDDDGTGYLYFGGGHDADKFEHPKTARCVKLGDDMISIEGEPQEIDAPYLFEDSGINKINGTYYYTYCTNWVSRTVTKDSDIPPTAVIAYMTSDNPLGPFTYRGWTLKNPGAYFGASGNNHHWIFEFKGKKYIAYHAQTMEKLVGLDKGGYRGIYISDFAVNADGTFPVQTKCIYAIDQVGTFNPYEEVPAVTYQSLKNVAVTSNRLLTPTADGGYVCIKGVDFGNGASKIVLNTIIEKKSKGGNLKVLVDGMEADSTVLADVKIGKKATTEKAVADVTGVHDLYFVFSGNFALSSWSFIAK